MLPTWYDAGTVSVTNGSTTVTGTSTLWGGDAIMPGDLFCDPAQPDIPPQRVASVTDNGELELWAEWPGTTITDGAYEIRYVGIIERSTAQTRRVLEQLGVVDANGRGLFFNFIGVSGDVDPGIGNVAVDDATFADITHIYIDDIDANTNGQDVTSTVSLWSPGTILILRSPRSAAYMSFRVASVTINSGYRDIEVTPVGSSSTLTTEAISIDWAIVGEGVTIDYVGTFAERDDYDSAEEGTFFVSIDGEDGLGGPSVLYRRETAVAGVWSPAIPFQGQPGDRGWAPVFAVVSDGARRVLRLVDYVGGEGDKPTDGINQYVSAAGMTATIGSATDIRGGTGAAGDDGADGADGVDGTDPGILFNWDDGTTDADPGAGNIRANNADLSAATILYVSKENRAGDDMEAYLLGFAGSTNPVKGGLTLTRTGGNAQAVVHVTGVTDATDYVKVAISSHSGTTAFIDADAVSFQFTRYGDQGSADAVSVASSINGADEVPNPAPSARFALTDQDNGGVLGWNTLAGLSLALFGPLGSLHVSLSTIALQSAENAGAAVFGPSWIADGFEDLAFVDLAGSANVDSSVPGALRPSFGTVNSSFTDSDSNGSDLTTYTFSSQSFGAAAADRMIVVGISSRANASRSIASVTIGGVAATEAATANNASGGADIAAIYIASVPSGTTGSIVVTFSNTMLRCGIGIWRLANLDSATPTDIAGNTNTAGVLSTAIDVEPGGIAIGAMIGGTSGGLNTWTGLIEDYDAAMPDTSSTVYSGAHKDFSSAAIGETVTVTVANTNGQNSLALAAWAPVAGAVDMTVLSEVLTALDVPTKMRAILQIKEIEEAVAGTDYTMECSRDGGTTWTSMPLTDLFTSPSPSSDTLYVEAAETDVTSQPSGSSPCWRFKTVTQKIIELRGVKFDWL